MTKYGSLVTAELDRVKETSTNCLRAIGGVLIDADDMAVADESLEK